MTETQSEQKLGIEAVKSVVELAKDVAVKSVAALKDGAQLSDLTIALDPELREDVVAVFKGRNDLLPEIKDLDAEETKQLIGLSIDLVVAILAEARK